MRRRSSQTPEATETDTTETDSTFDPTEPVEIARNDEGNARKRLSDYARPVLQRPVDVSFSGVVKTQRRWSKKIYKTELTKTRYNNQVLGKYRVDPQRASLTLIAELTWSKLGLKGVLKK